jgi:hypothetical protein
MNWCFDLVIPEGISVIRGGDMVGSPIKEVATLLMIGSRDHSIREGKFVLMVGLIHRSVMANQNGSIVVILPLDSLSILDQSRIISLLRTVLHGEKPVVSL